MPADLLTGEGPSLTQVLAAAALAAVVATLTWRWKMLSITGAAAAWAVGTAAAAHGWRWCALLLLFFVSSVALSRWQRTRKAERTGDTVEKGGARDGWQVLANGGVFAVLLLAGQPLAAAGALATAMADTWSTEVGTAIGDTPWSLRTWQRVAPGTSGAVTLTGTAALLAGAAVMGTTTLWMGFDPLGAAAIAVGGVAGALVDTLLGATIQERRRCPACQRCTEQRRHRCGTPTLPDGGWPGMTNDLVNLTSTLGGAGIAAWAWSVAR